MRVRGYRLNSLALSPSPSPLSLASISLRLSSLSLSHILPLAVNRPGKDNHFLADRQTLKLLLNDLNLAFMSGLAGSQESYLIGD
jgi:hypothetical protein